MRITNQRQQKRTVRIWFRCDDCGMWGDFTVANFAESEQVLALMTEGHECRRQEATA